MATKSSIVKGTTKSGIEFKMDANIKDDARLLFLLTRAQNSDDPMSAGKAIMDILTLIFGAEDNVLAFMNEVARTHKGVCKTEFMLAELQEMFDIVNAKNC